MLENLCSILIPIPQNQLDHHNKLKNKNPKNKSRRNKLKSKNLRSKRKNNLNNKNQLKLNQPRNPNLLQKSTLEPHTKEKKPDNQCLDSETESLKDSKKPKTITHFSPLSKKLICWTPLNAERNSDKTSTKSLEWNLVSWVSSSELQLWPFKSSLLSTLSSMETKSSEETISICQLLFLLQRVFWYLFWEIAKTWSSKISNS